MAVELTMPATIPASEAASYPKAWFSRILIDAADPNGDAQVHVDIVPYRTLKSGQKELMPNTQFRLHLEKLFAVSEYDATQIESLTQLLDKATAAQKLGLAQAAMYAALEAKGKELGVL